MKSTIFNELNQQQKQAVSYVDGSSIILAGAGSGKTRVLTYKVLHLIESHNISPEQIMMVTFTNKAAGEMKLRVNTKLGFIGTFHSFGVSVLRRYGEYVGLSRDFVIFDDADQQEIIKDILKSHNFSKKYTPSFYLNRISSAKDQLISAARYNELFKDFVSNIVGQVYEAYQKKLEKNNAVDFDDLIFKTTVLLAKEEKVRQKYQERFAHILVDEFQDTNFAQYQMTKYLGGGHHNVTVVGDFSQGIYSWRGAEIGNLDKFKQDFPEVKTFHLERNYRSTQKILDFAYDIISKNHTHPILKLYTEESVGEDVVIKQVENEQYEALYIAEEAQRLIQTNDEDLSSVAVLYRINAQSRVIEEAFLHMGIPYVLIGGTRFYERREIKDILSYVRLVVNPNDEVSLARVLKIGKKRFSDFKEVYNELKGETQDMVTSDIIDKILQKTRYVELFNEDEEEDIARLENIKELRSVAINFPHVNHFLEQVALVESEYSENEKLQKGKQGIHMMTLHQAKGLEFPYVFIPGVEEGILPHARSLDDIMELEEERRLFYVGITRARKKLYITYAKRRFFFGRRTNNQASRFLEDHNTYGSQDYF
jgi:DNA helicase-2/ATP-dependent DNA helicase PcrA